MELPGREGPGGHRRNRPSAAHRGPNERRGRTRDAVHSAGHDFRAVPAARQRPRACRRHAPYDPHSQRRGARARAPRMRHYQRLLLTLYSRPMHRGSHLGYAVRYRRHHPAFSLRSLNWPYCGRDLAHSVRRRMDRRHHGRCDDPVARPLASGTVHHLPDYSAANRGPLDLPERRGPVGGPAEHLGVCRGYRRRLAVRSSRRAFGRARDFHRAHAAHGTLRQNG